MVKLVALLKRPTYMSREDFEAWWLGEHSQLVKDYPGLRKYVVSLSVPSWMGEPFFDGIGELWFDDLASAQAAFTSPYAKKVGHTETVKHSEIIIRFWTEERVIVAGE